MANLTSIKLFKVRLLSLQFEDGLEFFANQYTVRVGSKGVWHSVTHERLVELLEAESRRKRKRRQR